MNGFIEFIDHLDRSQTAAVCPVAHGQVGEGVEQHQVTLDDPLDFRSEYFNGHLGPVMQASKVHLCHRGRGNGFSLEMGEILIQGFAISPFNNPYRFVTGKRRHTILELAQLKGDVFRQQIRTRRQHLSELDKDRAQLFQ